MLSDILTEKYYKQNVKDLQEFNHSEFQDFNSSCQNN